MIAGMTIRPVALLALLLLAGCGQPPGRAPAAFHYEPGIYAVDEPRNRELLDALLQSSVMVELNDADDIAVVYGVDGPRKYSLDLETLRAELACVCDKRQATVLLGEGVTAPALVDSVAAIMSELAFRTVVVQQTTPKHIVITEVIRN